MPFSSGSIIWPAAGALGVVAPVDPTTTYTASTAVIETTEQERWLLGRVIVPAAATADPGLRLRIDVSLDWDVATGIAAATWNEFSRVDIPNLNSDGAVAVSHWFKAKLPQNVKVLISARDMGGDPDTTITIQGWLRSADPGTGRNGQPLELRACQDEGAPAFNNAGAAEALGLALAVSTSGTWIPVGAATEAEIQCVTTGGPPTAVELDVQQTYQDIAAPTVFASLPVVNSVSAGNVNQWPGIEQLQSGAGTLANGTYITRLVSVKPGTMIRVRARRNGAAVNLLAVVRLFVVPAE